MHAATPTVPRQQAARAVIEHQEQGVPLARLDKTTTIAITHLFPKDHGLDFLRLLLLEAQIALEEIPGRGLVEVAMLSLISIEAFAKKYGKSKDTALRYIEVLEKLCIVFRRRHAAATELCIPLVPWLPAETMLLALDQLLSEDVASPRRKKLRQLAGTVKMRFLLLYGSPATWSTLFDDLSITLKDVHDLLNLRISSTKRLLIQLRIERLQARLNATYPRGDLRDGQPPALAAFSSQKGDFGSGARRPGEQSAQTAKSGDLTRRPQHHDSQSPTQRGDLCGTQDNVAGPLETEMGDPGRTRAHTDHKAAVVLGAPSADHVNLECSAPASDCTRPLNATCPGDVVPVPEGDLHQQSRDHRSLSPAKKGDFPGGSHPVVNGRFHAQEGDFPGAGQSVSISSISDRSVSNTNIDTINKDTDNDTQYPPACFEDRYTVVGAREEARRLAKFFEGNENTNTGGFVDKCKLCSHRTVRAAVIYALVRRIFPDADPEDNYPPLKGRGANLFHTACKKFNTPDVSLPRFVSKWLDTGLTWKDIESALEKAAAKYAGYLSRPGPAADLVRNWLNGEITEQQLEVALVSKLPVATGAGGKLWMDEAEAKQLAQQILQQAGPLGVSRAVTIVDKGVYVVELMWKGAPMKMKHAQEWETHFSKVQHVEASRRQRSAKAEDDGAIQRDPGQGANQSGWPAAAAFTTVKAGGKHASR